MHISKIKIKITDLSHGKVRLTKTLIKLQKLQKHLLQKQLGFLI